MLLSKLIFILSAESTTKSALEKSCFLVYLFGITMHFIPAFFAASTPTDESSIIVQSCGLTPNFLAVKI